MTQTYGTVDFLDLSGNARELGRVHGETMRPLVLEKAEWLASRLAGFEKGSVEKTRLQMMAVMAREFPWIVEEMAGISEGAGLDERTGQLLSLNTAFDGMVDLNDGCTNIAFSSSDRGPLLGKTLDSTRMDGHRLMATLRPDVGHAFVGMLSVGTVHSETGLNGAGLAVGSSSIHFKSRNPNGINRNIMTRLILQTCRTTAEAIAFLESHPTINRGYNFLFVDRIGDIANVERGTTTVGVRRSDSGIIHCANHCRTSDTRSDERLNDERRSNSHARVEFLDRITEGDDFERTFGQMESIIKSHGEPTGFCQHGQGNLHSFTAYLMVPREDRLVFWPGYPCCTEPQELQIPN